MVWNKEMFYNCCSSNFLQNMSLGTFIQANQEGLKFSDTHQFLVYSDDVYILVGSIHAIKKNTQALVVTSKAIGLEVNAEKTKYMVMFEDQNEGKIHSIKIDNKSFGRVEQFRYLGTILTNWNSIYEEINSRLMSGNACYHSVQNILSYSLQSKHIKINKIYRTIILPVVCMGVKFGCSHWGRTVGWWC